MGLARDFTKTIDPTRRGLWAVSDSVKNHKRHKVQVASSAAVSRSVGLSDVGMRPRVDELACISTHGREGRRRDLSVSTAAPRLALTGDAGWGWGEGGGDASRGAAYRQAGQSGRQAGQTGMQNCMLECTQSSKPIHRKLHLCCSTGIEVQKYTEKMTVYICVTDASI